MVSDCLNLREYCDVKDDPEDTGIGWETSEAIYFCFRLGLDLTIDSDKKLAQLSQKYPFDICSTIMLSTIIGIVMNSLDNCKA